MTDLPIGGPGPLTRGEFNEAMMNAKITFDEPFHVDFSKESWEGTQLREALEVFNNRHLMSDITTAVKVSYDRRPNGTFCGSLLYDGVVIWECGHPHSKPEYNRRSTLYDDYIWVASAANCATRAKVEFIDNIYTFPQERRLNDTFTAVTGTAGRYADSANTTGERRQDTFTLFLDTGRTQPTPYRLRIWNGDPRLLYVYADYRDQTGVIGHINLDQPDDTDGRPDPSLFPSPQHFREWLKVAAWGYENVWGDSFRRKTYEPHLATHKTVKTGDLAPEIPKRAADFFRTSAAAKEKTNEQGKSLEMTKDEQNTALDAGFWVRTNRDGRRRSYTVMYGDKEIEGPTLNRGEAIKKMEEIENSSNTPMFDTNKETQ